MSLDLTIITNQIEEVTKFEEGKSYEHRNENITSISF